MSKIQRSGPWDEVAVAAFLEAHRRPMRLACNGAVGHPVMASLWFVPEGDRLWCATQRSASVIAHLERDPRCAFEISQDVSPYRGVRGQAIAHVDPSRGESVLRRSIERYLGDGQTRLAHWLLSRAEDEVAIAIEPVTLVTWDFSARMEAAA